MQYELSKVHIQATVLMTADDVRVDRVQKDDYVTYLIRLPYLFFQSDAYIPEYRHKISSLFSLNVVKAIRGSLALRKTASLP